MNKYIFVKVTFLLLVALSSCNEKIKQESIDTETQKTEIDTLKRKTDYTKSGLQIAQKSKKVLGKNLMNAISKSGFEGAIGFCSEKAITLTDSISLALNAKVERVSDKNRNPNNRPNEEQLQYIEQAKIQLAKKHQPVPKVVEKGNKMVGFYPIVSNAMCLKCHGVPEKDIEPKTYERIQALYPEDKAIGYKTNELRGIWVVTMDK
ncbi:MAG: DUF3365 domain-containing protein [Flavobacteriales bacterium]|nr:DUF3365 domain-containing protein [Flavobacteriales bacterium]